jgi:hypothetical protein
VGSFVCGAFGFFSFAGHILSPPFGFALGSGLSFGGLHIGGRRGSSRSFWLVLVLWVWNLGEFFSLHGTLLVIFLSLAAISINEHSQ